MSHGRGKNTQTVQGRGQVTNVSGRGSNGSTNRPTGNGEGILRSRGGMTGIQHHI